MSPASLTASPEVEQVLSKLFDGMKRPTLIYLPRHGGYWALLPLAAISDGQCWRQLAAQLFPAPPSETGAGAGGTSSRPLA
jgi:hypothetical protein